MRQIDGDGSGGGVDDDGGGNGGDELEMKSAEGATEWARREQRSSAINWRSRGRRR